MSIDAGLCIKPMYKQQLLHFWHVEGGVLFRMVGVNRTELSRSF